MNTTPLSLDKEIIDCWRAHARAEFVRKAVSDKFKIMVNELNPLLQRINPRLKFDARNVTGGGSYITNDDGTVSVYIILPTIYPTRDDTHTMGPFFLRVNDARHSRNEDCRYCVNLDKVGTLQQLAEIISGCLLHPEDITPKYMRHGLIIPEAETRAKLIALY